MTDALSIKTRFAVSEDAKAMARIHTEAIHAAGPPYYSDEVVTEWANPDLETVIAQIADCILNKGMLAIVARIDREITGYGLANLTKCYMGAIYVAPERMGGGVGSGILLRLEQEAVNRGVDHFYLDASLNSETFYRKNGYRVIERGSHTLQSGAQMICVKMEKALKQKAKPGKVIVINGASSSGKTMLATGLQEALEGPYFHISIDNYLHQLPDKFWDDDDKVAQAFPILIDGFYESAAAMARSGNNIIVDTDIEPEDMPAFEAAFKDIEVTTVGVHCSAEILEIREKDRGDRKIGMARSQSQRVHTSFAYDVEVDTSLPSIEASIEDVSSLINRDR